MKIFLFFLTYFLAAGCKIIYALAMLRHGSIYPKTEIYPIQTGGQFGRLTIVGMRQQYNMGRYLRDEYLIKQGLSSPSFNRSVVEFLSSELIRSAQSVLCVMQGMYPLGTGPTIPKNIPNELLQPPYKPLYPNGLHTQPQEISFALSKGFQPISTKGIDHILDSCDNYIGLREYHIENEIRDQLLELKRKRAPEMERLKQIFNLSDALVNPTNLSELFKVIDEARALNITLTPNFTKADARELKYIYLHFHTLLHQGIFDIASISSTLSFMHGRMEAVLRGGDLRMTLFCLHQSNIWPLMNLLNLTSYECVDEKEKRLPVTTPNCVRRPAFSTNLIFEVHEEEGKKVVKMRYNGKYVHLCEREDFECPAEEFNQRIADKIIDYKQLCRIPDWMPKPVHISLLQSP